MTKPEAEALDNAPEAIRKAVRQLSFAYSRSEQTLSATQAERLSDALRRAEAVLFAAGQPLSAEQVAETLPQGVEAAEVLMLLQAQYRHRGVQLVEGRERGLVGEVVFAVILDAQTQGTPVRRNGRRGDHVDVGSIQNRRLVRGRFRRRKLLTEAIDLGRVRVVDRNDLAARILEPVTHPKDVAVVESDGSKLEITL